MFLNCYWNQFKFAKRYPYMHRRHTERRGKMEVRRNWNVMQKKHVENKPQAAYYQR